MRREHDPNVYSMVWAGGGIRGGQVFGAIDRSGGAVKEKLYSPARVHANVFQAMGISPRAELTDRVGRSFQIGDGCPLLLF